MKRLLYIILALATLSNHAFGFSRDSLNNYPNYNKRVLQTIRQQWGVTDNAAGMTFADVSKGSFATLERYLSQGDHHRVQEGSSNKGLTFSTERYDKFNDKILVRGAFAFNLNKEYDRAWSDVINTYNSNPFIYGSSVRGNYEQQRFDLNLKLYSRLNGRFNYGLTIDYHVYDIARQRDPRSRTYALDYSLIPAITYSLNKVSTIGLNLLYRYNKEKMPSLSTVQTDPNLKYYTFTGNENATGRIGGYRGFQRQFLSDYAGVALQYGYNKESVSLVLSAGLDYQYQQTLGDKKQTPGSYNSFNYKFKADLIINRPSFMHNIRANITLYDGGANEYRQRLESERDTLTGITTETWVTIYTYKNRYIVKTNDFDAKWRVFALENNGAGYKWSAGLSAGYSSFSNLYYLPSSEYSASRVHYGAEGSTTLYNKKGSRVELDLSVRFSNKTDSKLEVSNDTEIFRNVLNPDFEYHNRSTSQVGGSLKYTFPLRVVKNTKMSGYAKLYGGNLFASESRNWSSFGIALGILTL